MSKRWTMMFVVWCSSCIGLPVFVQGQSANDSSFRFEMLQKIICRNENIPLKSPQVKQGQGDRGFIVSPDCMRVAFVFCEKGKESVVVDGKGHKQYDRIGKDYPIFSPDSKRVAYIAQQGKKQFVVLDEKEGKRYDGIWEGSLIFSPDSKQLAYVAQKGNEQFVVVNGKEEKHYEAVGDIAFSADSKQLAYVAQQGDKQFVLFDGKAERQYDSIKSLLFNPDNNKIAYIATEGDKQFVVIGGNEDKKYDNIKSLVFSPDGNYAYIVQQDKEWFVVLNGEEQKYYYGIYSLTFSPDGKRYAYIAKPDFRDSKYIAIIDGKEDGVSLYVYNSRSLTFSPDSNKVAYSGRDGSGREVTIVNGKTISQSGGIPFFSPDSKRIAFLYGSSIIIDGNNVENYGLIGRKVVFDSPNSLHWIALQKDVNQNNVCVLVRMKIK